MYHTYWIPEYLRMDEYSMKKTERSPFRLLLVGLLMLSPLLMAPRTLKVTAGGRVSYISGKTNVKKGQLVKPGQSVTTGSNGRVELTFSDGSRLRIGSASHLLLISDDPAKRQTMARLNKGKVWNQVRPAPQKKMIVRGRHSVAAVLGTTYSLEVSDTATQTAVFKGSVGIHRPFEMPESHLGELFQKMPASLPSSQPQESSKGFQQPKQVDSPVHEIPSPVRVIPGPVEVSMEQWLQIVENQQITMGDAGLAQVRTLDPAQLRKTDTWYQWNTQMDAQPARTE